MAVAARVGLEDYQEPTIARQCVCLNKLHTFAVDSMRGKPLARFYTDALARSDESNKCELATVYVCFCFRATVYVIA